VASSCPPLQKFLLTGLSVGLFATGLRGSANDMVGLTSGALELFTYFGLIAIVMMRVCQLAPLSGDRQALRRLHRCRVRDRQVTSGVRIPRLRTFESRTGHVLCRNLPFDRAGSA
jgi:hypothetical protein